MYPPWVKETTSTTGTGTITLAGADTGFMAFDDAPIVDGQLVEYWVKSGNNREHGYGTYTLSGTTLARTVVIETLVSGTYDNTSPIAITLAGTSDVFLSPAFSSDVELPVLPDDLGAAYVVNQAQNGDAVTTQVVVADQFYCMPFRLAKTRTITSLFTTCNATVGTKYRLGIYDINSSGLPGNLLRETADVTPATGKVETSITSITLSPGWYYIALIHDGAATMHKFGNLAGSGLPLGYRGSGAAGTTFTRGFNRNVASWTTLPATGGFVTGDRDNARTMFVGMIE